MLGGQWPRQTTRSSEPARVTSRRDMASDADKCWNSGESRGPDRSGLQRIADGHASTRRLGGSRRGSLRLEPRRENAAALSRDCGRDDRVAQGGWDQSHRFRSVERSPSSRAPNRSRRNCAPHPSVSGTKRLSVRSILHGSQELPAVTSEHSNGFGANLRGPRP